MMMLNQNVLFLFVLLLNISYLKCSNRTFTVDWDNNQFLKDGKPFRYVSGTMHYFRVPYQFWEDRIRKMKFAGLNALQTYIEWSSHEPKSGHYNFEGQNNIIQYIKLAQKYELLVVLRIGPYICAERDMGGFPYWLLKIPGIKLRSSDPKYLKPVDSWMDVLLPKIKPLLYKNGGPIITIQIENEYGSYSDDRSYPTHLRDKVRSILGNDVVLFTTDGNGDKYLQNGSVADVLTTIDFGVGTKVEDALQTLRRHLAKGPFVNSEYYIGWFDSWENQYSHYDDKSCADTLEKMLKLNASVNIYVFHGGTNFDFTSSTLYLDVFTRVMTSYQFDAPINEQGDLTPKFYALKEVIKKYLPVVDDERYLDKIVNTSKKMAIPSIKMNFGGTLFDLFSKEPSLTVKNPSDTSFEEADHPYGYLLYQTNITFQPTNPAVLSVPGLRDRAHVFVDRKFIGILSRTRSYYDISLLASNGSELSLLVENQGRCSFECFAEKKGIMSHVKLGNHQLQNWKVYKIFEDWKKVINNLHVLPNDLFKKYYKQSSMKIESEHYKVPSFYVGKFKIPENIKEPLDSFLKVDGWFKGSAFLNGYNLGRYWPIAGPQKTLYAPSVLFKGNGQDNEIVLFETDNSPCWYKDKCSVEFVTQHVVNGTFAH